MVHLDLKEFISINLLYFLFKKVFVITKIQLYKRKKLEKILSNVSDPNSHDMINRYIE